MLVVDVGSGDGLEVVRVSSEVEGGVTAVLVEEDGVEVEVP